MGLGDDLMATGDAKVFQESNPGVLCAFGNAEDRRPHDSIVYKNNPRICRNVFTTPNIKWIPNYPGCRPYIKGRFGQTVEYNTDYKPNAGEIYFSDDEKFALPEKPYIYVEPNTKTQADDGRVLFPIGFNKRWIHSRWKELLERLSKDYLIVQGGDVNAQSQTFVRRIYTNTFREALWLIANADLVISTDGACHHAAAALGRKAVVIWGGVTSPTFLGYDTHTNLWGGDGPCGSLQRCQHCKEAMEKITVDMVEDAARGLL